MCACVLSHFSCVWIFVTQWTIACQAPLFMGFSRQGYWSGLPFPPSGDLPDPGIEPMSLMSSALWVCVCECSVVSESFVTLWAVACQDPLSMDFPGKDIGVGCHFLLQEIFPTQGSNPGLPHCRQMLYHTVVPH